MKVTLINNKFRPGGETILTKKRFELLMKLARFFNENISEVEYLQTQAGFSFTLNPEITTEDLSMLSTEVREVLGIDLQMFLEDMNTRPINAQQLMTEI